MTAARILHVSGTKVYGGDSVLIVELGREARDHGFEVDVLTTNARLKREVLEAGLGVVDLDVIRREIRPWWDARGLWRLIGFLSAERYSLVHTHNSKPGIVGRLAATKAAVPAIVHTAHLFPFHEHTGRAVTEAYVRCERLAAQWCHRIVTVSEFQRAWALGVGIGKPEQVVAIPNGVPTRRVRPRRLQTDVRRELGVDEGLMILFTGRLAEQKGLEHLLRAAAILRADLPDAVFVITGEGPLESRLRKLVVELDLARSVRLVGFRRDVGDLLAACDMVVLPSLWEGLPISLLEAMAAGVPVVATDIGGNREATGDGECAVLVPPGDPVRLADGILALAKDDPLRAALGWRGQALQRQRFSVERMLDAYLDQYEVLLARSGAVRPEERVPVTSA